MEPLLISIAAAAAGKASEAMLKAGGAAVKRAAELVRRRFEGTAELEQTVQGQLSVQDFAEAIRRTCSEDDDFRRHLTEVAGTKIQAVGFHNEFHGGVKNVIQADTIQNLRLE